MKFKKLLVAIPIMIALVLPCALPLMSFAWGSSEIDGNYVLTGRSENQPSRLYAYFDTVDEPTGQTVYHSITFNVGNTVDNGGATVTYNDGVWKFTITGNDTVWVRQKYNFENPRNGDYVTQETYEYIKVVELNLNERSVSFYRVNGSTISSTPSLTANVDDNNLQIKECTIFDFENFPEGELKFTFSPSLSGDVDRTITYTPSFGSQEIPENAPPGFDSPRTITSDSFTMYIDNGTSKNYQYLFCICDKGDDITFASRGDDDYTVGCTYSYRVPVYAYWKSEWNYQLDSSQYKGDPRNSVNIPDPYINYTASLSLSPSPWHYIGAGQSSAVNFSWTEMDLNKDSEYTVYVYAVETELDYPSRQILQSDGDYYINLSTVERVYSSTFRAVNPMQFDINYGNGDWNKHIVSHKGAEYATLSWMSQATKDEYGGLDIGLKNRYGDASVASSGKAAWESVRSHGSGSSLPDYVTFDNTFSNCFGFVIEFFNNLPIAYHQIYLLGFTCIVVIGVIKAVK